MHAWTGLSRFSIQVQRYRPTDSAEEPKKLGRQSLSDQRFFKRSKVGHRIAAEAAAQRSDRLAPLQRPTQITQAFKSPGTRSATVTGRSRVAADAASRTNRAPPSPGTPPCGRWHALVVAVRAEELLQVVVRPRQIGHAGAGEQPRPVTSRHLQEVREGPGQATAGPAMTGNRGDQAAGAAQHPVASNPFLLRRITAAPDVPICISRLQRFSCGSLFVGRYRRLEFRAAALRSTNS